MRQIVKGPEPPSLTAHRQTEHSDYGNYRQKNELRASLVNEQRSLCCYCMKRIYPDNASMKIEHWQSQEEHPTEQLVYQNLLGGCLGGKGQPPDRQHCDTLKGRRDLTFNPANPTHHIETRITYSLDGSIHSNDADFDRELEEVLNLNLDQFKNNRKSMLDVVLAWWKDEKRRLRGPIPRAHIEQEIERHAGGNGALQPYSRIAVWWLEQKLAGMAA